MKKRFINIAPYLLYSITIIGILLNFTLFPSIKQINVDEFQSYTQKLFSNVREIESSLNAHFKNDNSDFKIYISCSFDNFSQYNNDVLTLTVSLVNDSLISPNSYRNIFNEFKSLCMNNSFIKSRNGLNLILSRYDTDYKKIEIFNDRIRKNSYR